jgi:hypothetical protein
MGAISVLLGVLIIVVVGAICFWVIDRFAPGMPDSNSCSSFLSC